MNKNLEMKKLIGDLEMMAAAAEPGVVVTEEMSVSCCVTLLKAANELRLRLNGEKGAYTP